MLKWTDCTADNAEFTNQYDHAVREVRRVLGSYDHIAHMIFSETGKSVSGVSVRRWLKNRNLPVNMACTIVDLVAQKDSDAQVVLSMFFPYLEEYFDGFLD
jgi:hypothetical protein